jgi:hypothetical protein
MVLFCCIIAANVSAIPMSPVTPSTYDVNAAQVNAVSQMTAINKSLSGFFLPLKCPAGFDCKPITSTGFGGKLDPALKVSSTKKVDPLTTGFSQMKLPVALKK